MNAAIYARVSTKDKGQEYENQLLQLRKFASQMGWSIVHEYCDRKTGKTDDRTQFRAMFAAASRREFDVVLFWSLDRFTREGTRETLNHLNTLQAYGVGWRSYQEQYIDSMGPFADVVISIFATLAKQERIRLSERTKAGLERVRKAGTTLGRPAKGDDYKLVARLRKLRSEGQSIRTIATQLGISPATAHKLVKAEAA